VLLLSFVAAHTHNKSFSFFACRSLNQKVLSRFAFMSHSSSLFAGFLKTGTKGSAQGNFGLMDLVAGLHWLRENLPAFNGNPNMVTLMGHGHGAALANILMVSPVASGM